MKKNNILTTLLLVLVSSFTILVLFSPNEKGEGTILAQTEESSEVAEGNSTFSDSNASGINDQDISTVIVIPNPQSTSSNSTQNSSDTSKDVRLNADVENKVDSLSTSPPLALEEVPRQNESTKSSSTISNATQRGEYKVDDNGVHYYDINNCSLVKGSSGVGDLSECEDAERVIQKEVGG